jgi:hypothetical protein
MCGSQVEVKSLSAGDGKTYPKKGELAWHAVASMWPHG